MVAPRAPLRPPGCSTSLESCRGHAPNRAAPWQSPSHVVHRPHEAQSSQHCSLNVMPKDVRARSERTSEATIMSTHIIDFVQWKCHILEGERGNTTCAGELSSAWGAPETGAPGEPHVALRKWPISSGRPMRDMYAADHNSGSAPATSRASTHWRISEAGSPVSGSHSSPGRGITAASLAAA